MIVIYMDFAYNKSVIIKHKTPIKMWGVILWNDLYASNTSIEAFLNLDYAQFIAVKDFLHPEAQYSTEHGVKGEEYDNVIFVISKNRLSSQK